MESPLPALLVLALLAGLAMPFGALLGGIRLKDNWLDTELRHGVMAFGGGALVSAVALVLVPEGAGALSAPVATGTFVLGGLAFMGLDIWLARHDTPASQLAAMLSDFVPEALALGATFTVKPMGSVALLAGLIALQNLPEGFNAFHELKSSGRFTARRIVGSFTLMALLGPLAGLVGYHALSGRDTAVGIIMLFAAGGILYSVFQDIAPQARLQRHWAPALGAVLGFALGLAGYLVSGSAG